jgi:tetratricopeptide (TPR) repeat protein
MVRVPANHFLFPEIENAERLLPGSEPVRLPKRRSSSPAAGIAVFLALLAGVFAYLGFRPPAPAVSAPENLTQLEPQLRDYISQTLGWVREAPRRADRHATLGLIYAVNGLWKEAHQAFQNAALLDSNEPLAMMYVGVSTQEQNDFGEAIKSFRELTVRFPNFAPGFYRLGYALLRTGNVDEAERAFTRLTALAPEEWRGHAGLGEIMLRKGQNAAAVLFLEKAVHLDFNAKSAHHQLGQAYQNLGRQEEAEWELQLGRNADHSPMPDAWSQTASRHIRILQGQSQLATEFADAGEPAKAVELLVKAYAYHQDNPTLMNQLAIALNRSGQPAKACQILKKALEKDERNVPALITLSLCQQKLDQNDAALATAERAITLAPNIAQGYVAKANALLATERDNDALAALESAARLDPQNAEIPMEIGDVLWRNLNRPMEAKERYEMARKLDPVLLPVYVRLADLYLQLKEINPARTCLDKARRLSPNLPDLAVLDQQLRKLEGR